MVRHRRAPGQAEAAVVKLREVVSCHACLRATRDWEYVALSIGGRKTIAHSLCRSCQSEVCDAVRRTVRELRGAAVTGR